MSCGTGLGDGIKHLPGSAPGGDLNAGNVEALIYGEPVGVHGAIGLGECYNRDAALTGNG